MSCSYLIALAGLLVHFVTFNFVLLLVQCLKLMFKLYSLLTREKKKKKEVSLHCLHEY